MPKVETIDKMPVAVWTKKLNKSGYRQTQDVTGRIYLGKDVNGNIGLYFMIRTKFVIYQVQIDKKRLCAMLKNAMKR